MESRAAKKDFSGLTERELLALAISLEEEDARIYDEFAEGLREAYPDTAQMFSAMADEERPPASAAHALSKQVRRARSAHPAQDVRVAAGRPQAPARVRDRDPDRNGVDVRRRGRARQARPARSHGVTQGPAYQLLRMPTAKPRGSAPRMSGVSRACA